MDADVRLRYETIFKQHFGTVAMVTSTTCIRSPTAWKPGGVLLAVVRHWSQYVNRTSRDPLGWWASATLTGSDGTNLSIFSCYNVVDTRLESVGADTIFAQQHHLV